MEKYEMLPMQLIQHGIVSDEYFFEPTAQAVYDYTIHEEQYLERFFSVQLSKKEERGSGFKQSKLLIEREIQITNGTIEGAVSAIDYGVAFNIAGGTHHAFSNRPEGFCLLNDQAIASMHLLANGLAKKILIVDLDVHQGNGTAEILKEQPHIFTFSMHASSNYPLEKQTSDLDIPLPDHILASDYLQLLSSNLEVLYREFRPDFTFFQAGVDILGSDKLGRLNMSIQTCAERDAIVFKAAKANNNPVMVTMGGGYSPDINTILKAHCNTFEAASEIMLD